MSLTFVYRKNGRIVSYKKEQKDLPIHAIRFRKKYWDVNTWKIRSQFQEYSTCFFPVCSPEYSFNYDPCLIIISPSGWLKITGDNKEKVLKNIEYFEKIIHENKIIPKKKIKLRDLL